MLHDAVCACGCRSWRLERDGRGIHVFCERCAARLQDAKAEWVPTFAPEPDEIVFNEV